MVFKIFIQLWPLAIHKSNGRAEAHSNTIEIEIERERVSVHIWMFIHLATKMHWPICLPLVFTLSPSLSLSTDSAISLFPYNIFRCDCGLLLYLHSWAFHFLYIIWLTPLVLCKFFRSWNAFGKCSVDVGNSRAHTNVMNLCWMANNNKRIEKEQCLRSAHSHRLAHKWHGSAFVNILSL